MNILLVGGSNSLMNQLIKKLNKEGHRVSVLTGSHHRREWYERVFERYDFPYDSVSIPEVMESVSPDVTVFLGAYDSNFRWNGDRSEDPVRLIAGLMNLLTAFSSLRKGRFLFLSSEAVFSGSAGVTLTEEDAGDASDQRGMVLAQCEELCRSFRMTRSLDIVTVRLGGCYSIPRNRGEVSGILASFCLDALSGDPLRPAANHRLSLLHDADGVQFLSQLIQARELRYDRYQLSTEDFEEEELARMVQESYEEASWTSRKDKPSKVRILPDKSASPRDLSLSAQRFREEFGIRRVNQAEDGVRQMLQYMLRHKAVFLQDENAKPPWWKRLLTRFGWIISAIRPFVENLVCFLLVLLVNSLAADSPYFARLDLFLLYVLLFSILYGQQQASFSAILATAGQLYLQMQRRGGVAVFMDFSTYIWIAQLFILGLVVGYLKDRLGDQKDEAREDHSYMAGQIDDIKDINSSNVRVKDAMQTQIINQSDSVGKIYEITSSLSQYNYDEVLFYAAESLQKIMGSEDVAIYTVSGGPYARLFTATSPAARKLGNSVKYVELAELEEALTHHRVFINRRLDDRYPMMAGGIYDDDELRLILMVWTLPWEKMTLGQANLLEVTGALIQNAALRANRYLEAMHQERFVGDTPVLTPEAFRSLVEAYRKAERRSLTDFSVLRVDASNGDLTALGSALAKKMRPNDYIGELDGTCLFALLTNTDDHGAKVVAERLQGAGFLCRPVDEFRELT